MNIFYAPPEQINANVIKLTGQEAIHATKALRYSQGDAITVVDGAGGWYEGKVSFIAKETVQVAVQHARHKEQQQPRITLAMGIIKKRDRLEFAVEKAVELGVQEIVLFQGQHSVKQNVRTDRLESIILSAMKQSLQSWLPRLNVCRSLKAVVDMHGDSRCFVAHHEGEVVSMPELLNNESVNCVLFVGPEGGLSDEELELLEKRQAQFVKLGPTRLRAETAATCFVSGLTISR